MRLTKYIALWAIIALTACQSGDTTPKTDTPEITSDLSLRATSDIQTPSPIKAASFVPNSLATWLGHVILLDETGTLHRATTDSAETVSVGLGKYVDVIGLSREKKAGVFLALTPQGQVKAFVQKDDEGNFGPMAVSMDGPRFKRFCPFAEPSHSTILAETVTGDVATLAVEIFEDSSVTLKDQKSQYGINPCETNKNLQLSEDYLLKTDRAAKHLILTKGQTDLTVNITNGLSIGGINDIGFATVTTANMGSVFNEGVMLIADKTQGRLVLISRSYALKELETR